MRIDFRRKEARTFFSNTMKRKCGVPRYLPFESPPVCNQGLLPISGRTGSSDAGSEPDGHEDAAQGERMGGIPDVVWAPAWVRAAEQAGGREPDERTGCGAAPVWDGRLEPDAAVIDESGWPGARRQGLCGRLADRERRSQSRSRDCPGFHHKWEFRQPRDSGYGRDGPPPNDWVLRRDGRGQRLW